MKCPGFETLIDFLDGQLAEEERQRLKSHLDMGCADCLNNCVWYEQFRAVARADGSYRPATWVRKRVVDLINAERSRSAGRARPAESLANLVYDSLRRVSPAGARLAEASGRQLVYDVAGYSVDVQIARSSTAGFDLMGQVLRRDETGFGSVAGLLVDLVLDQRDVWSTVTSEFGEFIMHGVEPGPYGLRIEAGATIIRIEDLSVSE
jgi:hypothetical protein